MSPINASKLMPAYLLEAEKLRTNPGQWAAYESKGHCVVLAGPGSGKTKTLSVKLARMASEDVAWPRGIACLTYNKECVRELQRRLGQLGVSSGRHVVISTVHSFCLQHIVRPYGHLADLKIPSPLRVASEDEQERLFSEALKKTVGIDENPKKWRFNCDLHRRTRLNRKARAWREGDERLADVIERYEALLLKEGVIDFDGMMLLGLELIRDFKWVRKALGARFPILVVDEYQDLGHPLHEIVLNLCFRGEMRLLAVGDPDQSIYGFVGAEPRLLEDLSKRDDVEAVELGLNYRCGPTIIKASAAALDTEREYKAAREEPGTVDLYKIKEGLTQQVSHICDTLIPEALKRRDGRLLGDIAVLYKDKDDGEVIARAVEKRGWDFIRVDKGNPYPRTPLVFWLEDCAAWCAGGWKAGEPSLRSLIRTWTEFNHSASGAASERYLRVGLVRFLYQNRSEKILLSDWLRSFRATLLDKTFESEELLRDEAEAVTELQAICEAGKRLAGFTVGTFGGKAGTSRHLNLMTLHSAKGLEFDVVLIIGLEQGRVPNFSAIEKRDAGDDKDLKGDRRLFYVGLTRARHEVHLLYSEWYKNQYGRVFVNGRSEFLEEVEKALNRT